MSFPADPLPLKSELFIDGAWVDVTALGRVRNSDDVVIQRGYANEQANLRPSTCQFTLNNRDGLFSNRNPLSTYYRKLRRNVPFRQSVTEATPWARFPQWLSSFTTSLSGDTTNAADTDTAGRIYTVDKAVLDITGDIDVRVDVEPENWGTAEDHGMYLAMKWNQATSNRSWIFYINSGGTLGMATSSAGSALTFQAASTDAIDFSIPRQSLRVTVDVNNGSGGTDFRFYTSDSVTGTWTQLGSTLTGTGTTSLFNSNAPLAIGRQEAGVANPLFLGWPFVGKVHRVQVYNGIAGTLVADMNATAQTPGDTSWSDGLSTPNTWIVESPAEISDANYRFYGEVSEFPQEWDKTGTDVYVPVVASGITRRLTQGQSPIDSALYRFLKAEDHNGYWPCEDDSGATSLANSYPGGRPAEIADLTLGSDDELPASAGVAKITATTSKIRIVCAPAASTGNMYLLFFFKFDAAPGGTADMLNLYTNGTAQRIFMSCTSTSFRVEAFDGDGASLGFSNVLHSIDTAQWTAVQIRFADTGAGFDVTTQWLQVGENALTSDTFSVATGTVGVPQRLSVGLADSDLNNCAFAHIQTGATDYSIFSAPFVRAARAFIGEYAAERFLRLCAEAGVTGYVIGDPDETPQMGRQPITTLISALTECVDLDRGVMYEPRDLLGYIMRTRRSLYLQDGISIDYAAGELSGDLRPTDDDQQARNDVTVRRPAGSFARSVVEDGELGVDAVGRYDSSVSRNAYEDTQLPFLAGFETYLGTWDEVRYPNVEVEFARSVFLTPSGLTKASALAGVDVGDRLNLTGLPAWLPPDDVGLLVQGYREVLRNRGWQIRWNTGPYGPYQYANNLLQNENNNPHRRAAASSSYLVGAVDDNDTTLLVKTTSGPLWGTTAGKPDNFPLDVEVGGEVMTVSGITSFVMDTWTRSVSSGFGTADIGGAYSSSGGSASDYNVSGNIARITNGSVNVHRSVWLPDQTTDDFELFMVTASSAVATGASIIPYMIGRRIDGNNMYRFEVTFNTSSTVDARIRKVVAGTPTSIDSANGLFAYSAGTVVWCRVQGFGSMLRMKVWLTSAANEPDAWNVTVTDSDVTGYGAVGLGSILNTGNTNVNPETRFDDWEVRNPQRLAVSARSVNGVVKSHSVGDFVQVKNRFYAAL